MIARQKEREREEEEEDVEMAVEERVKRAEEAEAIQGILKALVEAMRQRVQKVGYCSCGFERFWVPSGRFEIR